MSRFTGEYAADRKAIHNAVRAAAGNRCIRCFHPEGDTPTPSSDHSRASRSRVSRPKTCPSPRTRSRRCSRRRRRLIERLTNEFDAWALSLHTPSLQTILALCPSDVRVGAWVKPFASFKPNVNPAYCWEPVIFRGGGTLGRERLTVRDYHSANITLRKGTSGAKPDSFCYWIFEFLGVKPDDEFHDLFPGSGAVSRAWREWSWQNSPRAGVAE